MPTTVNVPENGTQQSLKTPHGALFVGEQQRNLALFLTIKSITITDMVITIEEIAWRNQSDADVFNLHALKGITLSGLKDGVVTIECVGGKFEAPYCHLHPADGITYPLFITKHPYLSGEYIDVWVFDQVVAITNRPRKYVDDWFDRRCMTYTPTC